MARMVEFTKETTIGKDVFEKGSTQSVSDSLYDKLITSGEAKPMKKTKQTK